MNSLIERLQAALTDPQPEPAQALLGDLQNSPLADAVDQRLVETKLELAVWQKRWIPDPDLEGVGASIYRFLLRSRLQLTLGIEELEAAAKDVAKRARDNLGELPATPFVPQEPAQQAASSPLRQLCRLEGWEAGFALYQEDGSHPDCWRELLYRAGQVVIDAGLHAGNLRAEEAPPIYAERLNMPLEQARAVVARQLAQPTVAATPLLVYLQLLELRAQQQRRLGDAFSRQAFDAHVKAQGPIPVPLLAEALARP